MCERKGEGESIFGEGEGFMDKMWNCIGLLWQAEIGSSLETGMCPCASFYFFWSLDISLWVEAKENRKHTGWPKEIGNI